MKCDNKKTREELLQEIEVLKKTIHIQSHTIQTLIEKYVLHNKSRS